MKANEVPDKLYFGESDKGVLDIYSTKESDNEVEYIRADVFIEKASRWIEENICEYCEGENIIFTANNTQYIDILNQQQFIEDFIKYIKGE